MQPPSFVAARVLDRLLWPRLDAAQRRELAGHIVEVELLEPGVRFRLRLGASGFEVAPPGAPALVIRARTWPCCGWRVASTTPTACSSIAPW